MKIRRSCRSLDLKLEGGGENVEVVASFFCTIFIFHVCFLASWRKCALNSFWRHTDGLSVCGLKMATKAIDSDEKFASVRINQSQNEITKNHHKNGSHPPTIHPPCSDTTSLSLRDNHIQSSAPTPLNNDISSASTTFFVLVCSLFL